MEAIHDLAEREGDVVPDEFARHPKFRRQEHGRWITFRDAFDFANAHLAGKTCCILNLDIFLDPAANWAMAAELAARNVVLCLSRTEFDPAGAPYRDPQLMKGAFASSQDAWVFRAPIRIDRCEFHLGTLGCDNAIAHRLKEAGYRPVNAPQQFRVFHYDRARGKTVDNQHAIYAKERGHLARTYPEREGQYLLPDIDMLRSVDQVLEDLKVGDLDRYSVICDVLSRFVKIRHP